MKAPGWSIPSGLHCFEEMDIAIAIRRSLAVLEKGGIHVFPAHAEAEGGPWGGHFIALLAEVRRRGIPVKTLAEIRAELKPDRLPIRRIRMELLPGRSVPCAV